MEACPKEGVGAGSEQQVDLGNILGVEPEGF